MEQLEFVRLPFHLEEMGKIESLRYGCWYMLITRGQGHLAHSMLAHGFLAIEFLRSLPCRLENLSAVEFNQWKTAVEPFLRSLQATSEYFLQGKISERMVNAIFRLANHLQTCGYNAARPQFSFPESLQGPTTAQPKGSPPCENAHSPDAQESSNQDCSPVLPTGTTSTPISNGESGTPTKVGGLEPSSQMTSEEFKKESLKSTSVPSKSRRRTDNRNQAKTKR